jgi:TP901 family phage tail tape measure protein
MTGEVQGLEFYVSSSRALPEIERFESGIDRVTRALDGAGRTMESFDDKLDRLGRSRSSDGLEETAKETKQVAAAVRELIDLKRKEVEVATKQAEASRKASQARQEAMRQQREQAALEKRTDALRSLAQEEKAVQLVRRERERYRLTLQAEEEARRSGLAVGSAEHKDFVRRTVAVRELAKAQELAEKRQSAFGSSLGKLGITAGGVLRTITQLTAGFGAIYAVRSAVATISETEDSLRILQSVSGATAEEMDRLSAAANTLSLNTRFSFGEGTQTLINLAKAGASAEESMAALPSVANLARAGLISLEDAADTVVQTMAQFGLTIDQSTRIGDVLVKAADATTSSVDSLADSLRKVGPVGREFGISLETVTAAIAQMQQSGVQARVAGTGLAQIFKQLADPVNGPAGAADALARLNLSFDDVSPRNFTAALDRLADAGLTLQDATELVGTEFDYLLTTLVRNRDALKTLEGSLNAAGGDAAAKAAATVGTLGDAFASLSNAAERFALSSGKAGVASVLKDITRAGADALNVLSGDAKAMEKAGEAGVFLAGAAKGAGVAVAGIVAFNTIRSITSLAVAARGAGASVASLAAVARANPIGTIAAAAVAAGAAFTLFGDRASQARRKLAEYQQDAERAVAFDQRLQSLRLSALSGNLDSARAIVEATKEQLVALRQLQVRGKEALPINEILGVVEQKFPELVGRFRTLREELDAAQKAASGPLGVRTQEDVAAIEALKRELFFLSTEFEEVGVSFRALSDDRKDLVGFEVDTSKGIEIVSRVLNVLEGNANAAADALQTAAQASKQLQDGGGGTGGSGADHERVRTDALREFLIEKKREIDFADLSEEKQRRSKLLQEATNAAIASGRQLRLLDLVALEAIARMQDRQAKGATDEKRAKAVERIIIGLRNENDLLNEQGAARDALRKQQEVLGALSDLEIDKTSEEYQIILQLLDANRDLLEVEEKRSQARRGSRADRRQDQAILQLKQEEKALQLVGQERERYIEQIDAENQARQIGLEVGSAEFTDYVRRKIALDRIAKAQERTVALFQEMGEEGLSALEQIVIDSGKARDALDALWRDLQRIAYRQVAGAGIQQLITAAGTALAGYFAGGTPTAGPDSPTGRAGVVNSSTPGGGNNYLGRLSGGLIPAMGGAVVDEFSFLRRGSNTYSVAEGGATTPEAVFPLARNNRGQLGIIGAGGGGGESVTMVFPGVRNAQDARATRMTMSQRFRAAKAADRSGRVGLRPPQ